MSYVGVFITFLLFITQTFAAELAGEVVSVDGSVFIRADGRVAAKLKPAKSGDPVYAGDVVNTPSNGKIKILLKDKSIVDLGPSALFKVEGFKLNGGADRQADVSMMYGTLRAAVTQKIEGKGRFKVKTPSATMGVRGTEFMVKADVKNMAEIRNIILNPNKPLPVSSAPRAPEAAKTEIVVLQGQVDVKKEAPRLADGRVPANFKEEKVISMTAGTQLVTKQGDIAPMKTVVLDQKQLASITRNIRVMDNTFSKAVVIDTANMQAGAETIRAVVADIMRDMPAPRPPIITELLPGGFNPNDAFINRPLQGPAMRSLKIIVHKVTGGVQ